MSTITAPQTMNGQTSPVAQLNDFASHGCKVQAAAVELLESHPHFCGKHNQVTIRYANRCLQLSGKLPSYYLKQLAQEAVRPVAGVKQIDNRIAVTSTIDVLEGNSRTFERAKPIFSADTSNRRPR